MSIDLKKIIEQFPDCIANGDKLKGILSDLYASEPKGVINTLVTIVKSGIAKEMQNTAVTDLDKARWKKQLEDDYAISEKVVENCLALWLSAIAAGDETNVFIQKTVTKVPTKSALKPITISNADFEIKDGVLVKYKGSNPSVVIPDGVTSIGERAFYSCHGLESITIPNSVKNIGKAAFEHCCDLTSVKIPDSVTSIGEEAFCLCIKLTSVTIGNNVTSIGKKGFSDCRELTSITIPESVTSIAEKAFYFCMELTSITIPESVTSIGESAFADCDKLTYNVKDNLKYLGNSKNPYFYLAGSTSTSISEAKIDSNCRLVAVDAFKGCSGLTYNETDNLKYLGNSENPYLYLAGATSTSITEAKINLNCRHIGPCAFEGCRGLTSVTIPEGVTSIGESAFYGCGGLISVTIPENVTSIGKWAFSDCRGLTRIMIPDSVTFIEDGTFGECSGLASITIPESVTSIGCEAFHGCSGLTSVTIPDSVTSIGENVLGFCSGLTSITIGNSVTTIGEYAFMECTELTSITIGNSVTSIGESAFARCDKLIYNVKDHFKYLGNLEKPYLYLVGPTSIDITEATIDANCRLIGCGAFYNCSSLTSITIPNSVTSIGEKAFLACRSLKSITIPNNVTCIGNSAFLGCRRLTSIVYQGRKDQWIAVNAGEILDPKTPEFCVHCTDGDEQAFWVCPF